MAAAQLIIFLSERIKSDFQPLKAKKPHCSVREVEVVVSVVIILTLAEEGASEVENDGEPGDAEPDAETVVHSDTLDEESLEATVQEMEEPLLGGVGAMMPDHATGESALLVEVLLAVPGAPLHLGHTKTLTIGETHVLGIAKIVVLKSASLNVHCDFSVCSESLLIIN